MFLVVERSAIEPECVIQLVRGTSPAQEAETVALSCPEPNSADADRQSERARRVGAVQQSGGRTDSGVWTRELEYGCAAPGGRKDQEDGGVHEFTAGGAAQVLRQTSASQISYVFACFCMFLHVSAHRTEAVDTCS